MIIWFIPSHSFISHRILMFLFYEKVIKSSRTVGEYEDDECTCPLG